MKVLTNERIDFEQINGFLRSAATKLKKAGQIISLDEQIGFQTAYEAMLRASLGFLLSYGKRPRNMVGHHKVVIEFVAERLGSEYSALMHSFDVMRRKRNEAIYEPISTITETEAAEALRIANQLLKVVIEDIHTRNPQQKLLS